MKWTITYLLIKISFYNTVQSTRDAIIMSVLLSLVILIKGDGFKIWNYTVSLQKINRKKGVRIRRQLLGLQRTHVDVGLFIARLLNRVICGKIPISTSKCFHSYKEVGYQKSFKEVLFLIQLCLIELTGSLQL